MRYSNHSGRAALVLAVCAVVLALSGTAVAVSRYVVTSTGQIKPSVVAKLTGGALENLVGTDASSPSRITVAVGKIGVAAARCPTGTHLVTGGYVIESENLARSGSEVMYDAPNAVGAGANGWWVGVRAGSEPVRVEAKVVCAKPANG